MESNCPLCGHFLDASDGVHIDEESNSILLDGKAVKAPKRIRQILETLIEKSPRTVSRDFLMDDLYGLDTDEEEPSNQIISVFISHVRKALAGSNYEVVTIWGKGWLFRKKVFHAQKLKVEKTDEREILQRATG